MVFVGLEIGEPGAENLTENQEPRSENPNEQ